MGSQGEAVEVHPQLRIRVLWLWVPVHFRPYPTHYDFSALIWILGIPLCMFSYVTVVVVCTFHLMGILFMNKNLKYSTNAKKITHINLPYCESVTRIALIQVATLQNATCPKGWGGVGPFHSICRNVPVHFSHLQHEDGYPDFLTKSNINYNLPFTFP